MSRGTLSLLQKREERTAYLLILPWIAGFLIFELGPMAASLWFSVTRWDGVTDATFVGLGNYATLLFADKLFWKSMWVTLVYAAASIPLSVAVGLAIAVLMNQKIKGVAVWRTIYFLPSVISGVAVSVLWIAVLNPDYGILNGFLIAVGISHPPNWLNDARFALSALVLMSLWAAGGSMVIYLAGLQGIPTQLYEAAEIDGAGPARKFIHVTLPMLSPVIYFNVLMGLIHSFQVFTQAKVMTNGDPEYSTFFYALYLYNNAFRYLKMGYASAQAWILFVIILALTLSVMYLSKRFVHYEGMNPEAGR